MIAFAGLIIVILLPAAAIVQNSGKPYVNVSPSQSNFGYYTSSYMAENNLASSSYYTYYRPGESQAGNITVESFFADASNIQITGRSSTPLLTVYLNGMKNGPIEIDHLSQMTNETFNLEIESSPMFNLVGQQYIFPIFLNYTYSDALGRGYSGYTEIDVFVDPPGPSATPPPAFGNSFQIPVQYALIPVELAAYASISIYSWRKK
jgi:hypothetical protein